MFKDKTIFEVIHTGGLTMYILIFCSVVSLAVIIERLLYYYRRSRVSRQDLMEKIRKMHGQRQLYDVLELCRKTDTPHAKVAFLSGTDERCAESDGNGPVDASLKAVESVVHSGAEMLLYSVNAITSGSTESQGEVTVRLQLGGRVVNGVGADPDIVVASVKAYLSALNKLESKVERVSAQG